MAFKVSGVSINRENFLRKELTTKYDVGVVEEAIPLVGGVAGGGLTYATFKPCCDKLKEVLQDTYISNPNYKEKSEDIIDIECDIEFVTNKEAEL